MQNKNTANNLITQMNGSTSGLCGVAYGWIEFAMQRSREDEIDRELFSYFRSSCFK